MKIRTSCNRDCPDSCGMVATVKVVLRFDPKQRRDILLMAKCGWLCALWSANAPVPAESTDPGGGAVYYDTPVRLRRNER